MLKNAGVQKGLGRNKVDWSMRKEWFMAKVMVEDHVEGDDSDGRSTSVVEKGYEEWGVFPEDDSSDSVSPGVLFFAPEAQRVDAKRKARDSVRNTKRRATPFDQEVVDLVHRAMKGCGVEGF